MRVILSFDVIPKNPEDGITPDEAVNAVAAYFAGYSRKPNTVVSVYRHGQDDPMMVVNPVGTNVSGPEPW